MAERDAYAISRDGNTKQTNATTSDVQADTDALPAGVYDIKIITGASVAATWLVQLRDSINVNNVGDTHTLYTAAGQSAEFVITKLLLSRNERVRLLPEANIIGTSASSIFAYLVGKRGTSLAEE